MKKVILFSAFILFGLGVLGYTVEWTDTIDNGYQDVPKDVYFYNNYVYVFGCFYNGGDYDAYVVKYDTLGNILWADTVDNGNHDVFNSGAVDNNGNVYGVGYTYNISGDKDFLIEKYDSSGSFLWEKVIDNGGFEEFNGISIDSLGNIFVIGESEVSSIYDIVVAKYDSEGNEVWSDTIDSGNNDYGYGIAVYDTFVYVAGIYDGYLSFGKLSANNGDLIWADTSYTDEGEFRDIAIDNDGYVYAVGWFYNINNNDYITVKYDADGNIIWMDTIGTVYDDYAYSVDCDNNSNVFVFGTSDNDAYLIEYDSNGDSLWALRIDNGDIDDGQGISIDKNTNNFYLCYSSYIGTNSDWFVSKYDSGQSFVENNSLIEKVKISPISLNSAKIMFYNSDFYNIRVYGIDGRIIKNIRSYYSSGSSINIDLNIGIYYLVVEKNNSNICKKICIIEN